MKIYLIRHGKTKGNLEHRYVGRTDEDILDEERESLIWTESLPDQIYTSPMKRCVTTAYELFHQKRIEQGTFLRPMKVIEDFREMEFGAFEYMNYEELKEMPTYQKYIDSGGETAFPFGESKAQFTERVREAGEELFRKLLLDSGNEKGAAAFVVHGGTIMALLDSFSHPHQDYFTWQAENGCGYEARLTEHNGNMVLSDIRSVICRRKTLV